MKARTVCWIAPSAAIRYTLCLVKSFGSAEDAGLDEVGDRPTIANLVPSYAALAVDFGGNHESPDDFVTCDRVRKSACLVLTSTGGSFV